MQINDMFVYILMEIDPYLAPRLKLGTNFDLKAVLNKVLSVNFLIFDNFL